jgi:translocation and assembly module TamB
MAMSIVRAVVHWVGVAAAAVGALAVFAVALVGGALLHLETGAARRVVVDLANRGLAGEFRGAVHLTGLRRIHTDGIEGVDAVVQDPDGRVVAIVEGLSARVEWPALARSVLRGESDIRVRIVEARARVLDVRVTRGAGDLPAISHTFDARHPPPPGPSRRVSVSLALLEVELFCVQGVLPQPLLAHVAARAELPALGDRAVVTTIVGVAGDVPLEAHASLRGDHVDASLEVPMANPDAIRGLAPDVPLAQPLAAHAEVHGDLPVLQPSVHVGVGGGHIAVAGTVTLRSGSALSLRLAAVGIDPSRVVSGAPAGRLDGEAQISARLGASFVDAGFAARLENVRATVGSMRHAVVQGRLRGPFESPVGRVTVHAEELVVSGVVLDALSLEARGPLRTPRVLASVKSHTLPPVCAAASLVFGDRYVDVSQLTVTGFGDRVRGSARIRGKDMALRLLASHLDLHTLARFAGIDTDLRGTASFDADLRIDARGVAGHLKASADASRLGMIRTAHGRVGVQLHGRRIDGEFEATIDQTRAKATLDRVTLAGPPVEARAWRDATGAIDVRSSADLAALRGLLASSVSPRLEGRVALHLHVERSRPGSVPDAAVEASTQGLAVTGVTQGVELQLQASLLGASQRVTLDCSAVDRSGPVASVQLEAQPPVARLVDTGSGGSGWLEHMRFRAHAEVPRRDLSSLPAVLRRAGLRGQIGISLDATGPLVDPRARVHANGTSLRPVQSWPEAPFDAVFDASYDGRAAIVRGLLRRPEGVMLDVRADVDAPIHDLLTPGPAGPVWDAGATVAMHDLPLEAVPRLAALGIGGIASGVLSLEGLHRDARLEADVNLASPRLGGVCFQEGRLLVRIDRGRLAASTRVERSGSLAEASVTAAVHWGASMAPSLDPAQSVDATLRAHDFRASALMPLLGGLFDQLDGRIDADARVHVDPEFTTGQVDGEARISGATVEVAAFGEPLHDVNARVTMSRWGTLRIDDVTASGAMGRLTASAQAYFDGLVLRSAHAEVDIPADHRMPLSVEGVSLGEVSGRLRADATVSPDRSSVEVNVEVPQLQINLPDTSARSVQSLDLAPGVAVGAYQPDGRFVAVPLHAPEKPRSPGSFQVQAVVTLGKDVRIKRDANLDVQISGSARIDVAEKPRMEGTIHLTHGMVEVFGRRFAIDPASTLSFTGDASNPQLLVTARYDAPDQTRVFADLVGTPSKMKVNLRSEPSLSQDEIVGLLVFGSREGISGTPSASQQPDTTQAAASLASGFVTQGINKALSGITAIDVSTRLDTSQAANPRPEVEVRLSKDVSTKVIVQTGMPAPGEPRDVTLLSIQWRFRPRWSLETTVGDAGTTLVDVYWQHRY